ncbi:unnamed protein product [Psylliodes chrysocephalus]|uniref:Cyclic nucleotide-binding domain-containing protein n=1 Tax=Psylliodes chrysocephalus TaxID=3402493 RepID=A0A9P0CR95_9CUCU|nr:unnamed protein product [Psylliodes chrysocephala]
MPHRCELQDEKERRNSFLRPYAASKFKSRLLSCLMISEKNRYCALYFKSEESIIKEKIRHIESGYTYIIHPLSVFREWYEFWLLFYYFLAISIKLLDSGVRDPDTMCTDTKKTIFDDADKTFIIYVVFSTVMDVLNWIDIAVNFLTGYINEHTGLIELNPGEIAKSYIKGPYFITSVLTACPRFLFYAFYDHPPMILLGIQVSLTLLRGLRIISVMTLSKRFLPSNSIIVMIIMRWCILFAFVLHMSAMIHITVRRVIRFYFGLGLCRNILLFEHMQLYEIYPRYMFRSSAYLLSIVLPGEFIKEIDTSEGYILAILSYITGKIFVAGTWVITVSLCLTHNSLRIKYHNLMRQIEEYMLQKNLPIPLRKRIQEYYYFKYHGKYFKEDALSFLLSNPLKKEINLHICKTLITKVAILRHLETHKVSELVQYLIPEIYLAQDIIIQSGSVQDSLFFISSGTVAVYTHSGKEVCHLQDGRYFGEIDLILKKEQKCITTVIAVEICQIYRLKKVDFEKTLLSQRNVMREIIMYAESQLEYITLAEKKYKEQLFEKTYTAP